MPSIFVVYLVSILAWGDQPPGFNLPTPRQFFENLNKDNEAKKQKYQDCLRLNLATDGDVIGGASTICLKIQKCMGDKHPVQNCSDPKIKSHYQQYVGKTLRDLDLKSYFTSSQIVPEPKYSYKNGKPVLQKSELGSCLKQQIKSNGRFIGNAADLCEKPHLCLAGKILNTQNDGQSAEAIRRKQLQNDAIKCRDPYSKLPELYAKFVGNYYNQFYYEPEKTKGGEPSKVKPAEKSGKPTTRKKKTKSNSEVDNPDLIAGTVNNNPDAHPEQLSKVDPLEVQEKPKKEERTRDPQKSRSTESCFDSKFFANSDTDVHVDAKGILHIKGNPVKVEKVEGGNKPTLSKGERTGFGGLEDLGADRDGNLVLSYQIKRPKKENADGYNNINLWDTYEITFDKNSGKAKKVVQTVERNKRFIAGMWGKTPVKNGVKSPLKNVEENTNFPPKGYTRVEYNFKINDSMGCRLSSISDGDKELINYDQCREALTELENYKTECGAEHDRMVKGTNYNLPSLIAKINETCGSPKERETTPSAGDKTEDVTSPTGSVYE